MKKFHFLLCLALLIVPFSVHAKIVSYGSIYVDTVSKSLSVLDAKTGKRINIPALNIHAGSAVTKPINTLPEIFSTFRRGAKQVTQKSLNGIQNYDGKKIDTGKLGKTYAGKLLIDTKSPKRIWFVDPKTHTKIYLEQTLNSYGYVSNFIFSHIPQEKNPVINKTVSVVVSLPKKEFYPINKPNESLQVDGVGKFKITNSGNTFSALIVQRQGPVGDLIKRSSVQYMFDKGSEEDTFSPYSMKIRRDSSGKPESEIIYIPGKFSFQVSVYSCADIEKITTRSNCGDYPEKSWPKNGVTEEDLKKISPVAENSIDYEVK